MTWPHLASPVQFDECKADRHTSDLQSWSKGCRLSPCTITDPRLLDRTVVMILAVLVCPTFIPTLSVARIQYSSKLGCSLAPSSR